MKKQRSLRFIICVAYSFFLVGSLSGCSSVDLKGASDSAMAWDFEGPIGSEWSVDQTFDLGDGKILGLFNDKSKKYPSAAILRLGNIPPNTPVTLSFDLYFIGSWDSDGRLADRWTLSIKGGDTLIDMARFNYAYRNGAEETPHSKTGSLDTGRRVLNFWTVDHQITIPPDQIKGDSLTLVFRGYLTGQGTEFWALDNVMVSTGRGE